MSVPSVEEIRQDRLETTEAAAIPNPAPEKARPLSYPGARRLLAADIFQAFSGQGTQIVIGATAVLLVGANALEIGLMNAAGTLAFMLLGVPIGVWVDRRDARKALIFAKMCGALFKGVLALLLFSGHVSFGLLATMSVLMGIVGTLNNGAYTVRAAQVVPKAQVGAFYARTSFVLNVLGLILPALAGVALGALGAPLLVAIAALFSVAAALALVELNSPLLPSSEAVVSTGSTDGRPNNPSVEENVPSVEEGLQPRLETTEQTSPKRKFLSEIHEGITALRSDKLLLRLTLAFAIANFGLAIFSTIEDIMFLRDLGLSLQFYGLTFSFAAAGGLLAGVVAEPWARRIPRSHLLALTKATLALVAALPLLALLIPASALVVVTIFSFSWAFVQGLGGIQDSALEAERIPTEILGRVSSLRTTLTFGITVPVASLLGGLLGTFAGTIPVVIVFILLNAASAIIVWPVRKLT